VTSKDGRHAYTANAGSGTISGFIVGHDGSLSLAGRDGTFLHVLRENVGGRPRGTRPPVYRYR
jgi:hypothetical protein